MAARHLMLKNFPVQLTSFIGRQEEIGTITRLLASPACRLLTLVGTGGIGKTRLAMEAAMHLEEGFADGTYFVPLQAVAAPDALVYAIADVLDVGMYDQDKPHHQLLRYLQSRHLLLILDNFEHLLEGIDLIVDMLQQAPHVKLVVTSREVLRLQGEHIYEVDGFALPEEAIDLFTIRARQVRHHFVLDDNRQHVTRICQLVGYMPLAIELAASWIRLLSCDVIAAEIAKNIDFLATNLHDVPPRHRSMRAVFDQSWRLLSEDEQRVFCRLSVLRGAFTREAAESIAEAHLPLLESLVSQSLLRVDPQGHYTLHELLRQYAEERLRRDPIDCTQTQERHSQYYLGLVRGLDRKIKGREQIAALDEMEFALDNIQQAWRYAIEHRYADLIAPAAECLMLYHQMRCRLAEGYETFALAVDRFKGDQDNIRLYALLLMNKIWFSIFNAKDNRESVAELTDQLKEIALQAQMRGTAAMPFSQFHRLSDREQYIALVEDNLAAYRARGDEWGVAWLRHHLGSYAYYGGARDAERAKQLLTESLGSFERLGDMWSATWTQALLGLIAEDEGRFRDAHELYTARLHTCERVGDAGGVAWSLQQLAKTALELEDIHQARFYCRESLRVALDIGSKNSTIEALWRIASMYKRMEQYEQAIELLSLLLHHIDPSKPMPRPIKRHLDMLQSQVSHDVFKRAAQAAAHTSLPQLGRELLQQLTTSPNQSFAQLPEGVEPLSERELEVLRLAADGLSNREIAARLVVTLGTVKKHLNNIFSKLDVKRRTQAIERAHQWQLLS